MESRLSAADSKGREGYYGQLSMATEGEHPYSPTSKTFFKSLIPAGVKDVLPFQHKLKTSRSWGSEGADKANLILLYSSDCIWVYQICSELKYTTQMGKSSDPLKLDLLCSHKTTTAIESIRVITREVDSEKETLFTILFEDCKVSTVAFDYEVGALETLALHDLKNKDSDKLLGSSTAHHGAKPMLKTQSMEDYVGFAVVRDSCIISFHFSKKTGKHYAFDGKLLNNGVVVLQKE